MGDPLQGAILGPGPFHPVALHQSGGRGRSSRELQEPTAEAAPVSPAHILLFGRQSLGPIYLQRRLGDVTLPCAQEEETYLVNSWTVSVTPGEIKLCPRRPGRSTAEPSLEPRLPGVHWAPGFSFYLSIGVWQSHRTDHGDLRQGPSESR